MKRLLIVCILLLFTFPAFAVKLEPAVGKQHQNTFAIVQSDYIDARVLGAASAESHTVPTGYNFVMFNCVTAAGLAATFWADFDGTAAIPSSDVTDGTTCEANPRIRYVGGVTTISLIAPAACIVIMSWYE